MEMTKTKGGIAIGVGATALVLASAMPASAMELTGDWSGPGGCHLNATVWDTDPQGATGQVFATGAPSDCSRVWVSLHYTDSKGANKVVESYGAGAAVTPTGGSGSTARWICVAGRSSATGNWGTVRHLGNSGPCGTP